VLLQNCMAVVKSETPSSDDTNRVVGIKVEGTTDVEEEGGTERSSFPLIMSEPAVSCMSLCIQCYGHCTDIHECMKNVDFGDWVVNSCYENVSRILCFVVCSLYNACPRCC
jgi:hypothetical protein